MHALDKELSAEIEERAAKFGSQGATIDQLKAQIAEDTAALKTATAIREKEAAEFYEKNKDLVQSITNVKNAIDILSKHHRSASAFIQLDASLLASMRAVLKDLSFKMQMLQADKTETARAGKSTSFLSLSTDDHDVMSIFGKDESASTVPLEFAQKILSRAAQGASKSSFLQNGVAPSAGSYAPQSGQIFGILTTMKEEFEANLGEEQRNEKKAQADFEAMAKAKAEQIKVAKEKLDEFEEANADNIKALSDAKENLELCRAQRSKDVKFLQNLKTTCMDLDQQWAIRSKTRSQETQAVSEALKIITEDDAMDLLRQTASFVQVDAESQMRVRRVRAMAALRNAAKAPGFDDLLSAWHSRKSHGQKVSMLGSAGGTLLRGIC